jgi:hypothetical protein
METKRQINFIELAEAAMDLPRGSVVSFGPGVTCMEVEVCRGELWVTSETDPEDRVLKAGDRDRLSGRHLVAQALTDTRIRVA